MHNNLSGRTDAADSYNGQGIALGQQGRLDEAVSCFREALRLDPDRAEVHNNLGVALGEQGRVAEAAASFQQALALKPDYAEAHHNLAKAWLLMGKWIEAWPEYEWRSRATGGSQVNFPNPRWDGSPLRGRTILLHFEQGFGDTLHFIRYAPLVRAQGGRVIVACQPPLVRLLTRCLGIDEVVAWGPSSKVPGRYTALPAFDVHCPLPSLPGIFRTSQETVPADVPYISAEPKLTELWGQELRTQPGFKLGIVWQGSPTNTADARRSVPLQCFAPLATVPGVRVYSLQVGAPSSCLANAPFQVVDLGPRLHDFADTAGVLRALDLVIVVDTAVAHLAGAMGVPTWVALPFAPDWRWMLEREDSPWYPTMRLFRQRAWGGWTDVFERLRSELAKLVSDEPEKCGEIVPLPQPRDALAAEAHNNRGIELAKQSRFDEAIFCFREAVRADPRRAEAHFNIGLALREQGKREEAVEAFRQVTRLSPNYAATYFLLGALLKEMGKLEDAAVNFRAAIRCQPVNPEAFNDLGNILHELGQQQEAVASFDKALACRPGFATAYYNRGNVLKAMGRLAEAAASLQEALRFRPDYPEAYYGLGTVLSGQGNPSAAEAAFGNAIRLRPDYVEAHFSRALALTEQAKWPEAEAGLKEALRLKHDYAEVHFALATHRLRLGDFAQGWAGYEWRWRCADFAAALYSHPLWDGSPLAGRTILVHTEQGHGDTLQFVRYAPLVKRRGGRVVLACDQMLLTLLARCPGVDQVIRKGAALPPIDVRVPLLSLAGLCQTNEKNLPSEVPYLHVDPQRRAFWARELGDIAEFKVGIAWQGSRNHVRDRQRSAPLASFESLAAIPGVRLFSLQVGPGTEQLAEAPLPITPLGERFKDFDDTAAALTALDLVVTVDTAVAHLAGGLGLPVWLALPFVADWRWLLERDDSPWYPTMRLFRQRVPGAWREVFDRSAAAVRQLMDAKNHLHVESRPVVPCELNSSAVDALIRRGVADMNQGRLESAAASFREAVGAAPNRAEIHNNLGVALGMLGRLEQAELSLREALRLKPDYAGAHLCLATTLLLMGRLEDAWPHYEWRWQVQELAPPSFQQPVWRGEPLVGRTLVLHTEQGLGDALQFIRYARLVQQRGARVVVTSEKSLVRLFQRCPGIDQVVPKGTALPPFDFHAPLLSIPGAFRTRLSTIPADVPYLHVDVAAATAWREEMAAFPGFKIGIAWQGSSHHKDNARRNLRLENFAPIAALTGVRLYSLQVGPGTEQISAAPFPLTPLGERFRDFADTAAAVSALDLVITVDTAIAHLAGALGAPVWVALPFAPDWRWLLDRAESPWYPSMRLFRQKAWGNWHDVLAQLTAEVETKLTATHSAPTIQRALADAVEAHVNRGISLGQQGKLDEAVASFQEALLRAPDHVEAQHNLGVALGQQGKWTEAAASFRETLRRAPEHAMAHKNLGIVLIHLAGECQQQGNLDAALAGYEEALRHIPQDAQAHFGLASTQHLRGKLAEAEQSYRRTLQLQPTHAEAENNLGAVLDALGRSKEALAAYRRAAALSPTNAATELNLARALWIASRLDEAERSCRRALALQPNLVDAELLLGNILQSQGLLAEACASYRRALALRPDFALAHSNLLYTLNFLPRMSLADLAVEHAAWDTTHAAPLRASWRHHANVPDPERKLRLGFVSPYFRNHPVAYLSIAAFECLDATQCTATFYANGGGQDAVSNRFAAAGAWRPVGHLSDAELAEQIRADGIDILFDLAGHTSGGRLLLFARKPAPIQVAWLSYMATSGLEAMDYLVADRYHVPEGAEHHYREQVLRLPDSLFCYGPPSAAPAVGPLPAVANGQVTFGSFNIVPKITAEVAAAWAAILRGVPGSRLIFKNRGFDQESISARIRAWFGTHGIDAGRLDFLGQSEQAELLAWYNRIDIALDPFPFSGSTTTCESLWMGVPVVTCPGETFASRHSLSDLANVGLMELVAPDLTAYVEVAIGLARDLPRLVELRAGLRQRMRSSPLCDGQRLADNLLFALRNVWRDWCKGQKL